MPTKKKDLPSELHDWKFEKQPSGGEKSKLCCWYALYHYANGKFMDIEKFKKAGAKFYAEKLGMSEPDALALLLDGNDPALAKALKPSKAGTAHVMNLKNEHFYTIREILIVPEGGKAKDGTKQWWSFDSYNFSCPQLLASKGKAPGSVIF